MSRDVTVIGNTGRGLVLPALIAGAGQARRVADFLLAWLNAEENGGWDPVDLWNLDAAIAHDMLLVFELIRQSHRYPGDIGFEKEIQSVWRRWRADRKPSPKT